MNLRNKHAQQTHTSEKKQVPRRLRCASGFANKNYLRNWLGISLRVIRVRCLRPLQSAKPTCRRKAFRAGVENKNTLLFYDHGAPRHAHKSTHLDALSGGGCRKAELLHQSSETRILAQSPCPRVQRWQWFFFMSQVAQLLIGPITPDFCWWLARALY